MPHIDIRGVDAGTAYFVDACSHVHESAEMDACANRRCVALDALRERGAHVKVALCDSEMVGFLYLLPIEVSPWGPIGRDLAVVPCLYVMPQGKGRGIGHLLLRAAEDHARHQGRKGIVTIAYYGDFWFMPALFFERCGFSVACRRGDQAILWKVFDRTAEAPAFLEPRYQFRPQPGKVVVDLFWNRFCLTSDIEAKRVREVAAEFGDLVALNEYCADDREVLLAHQIPSAIFIDGAKIGWGHEAPREGIREAINRALDRNGAGAAT